MVTCEQGRFVMGGKPFFLYSGEIHYFRLSPGLWDRHLEAARAAGFNAVSSYVPWMWHEPEEGRFDFSGATHPQRNLLRYLERVAAHGLRFVARIGPVSNAELVNEGIPGWLLRAHPDVSVRGRDITNLPHTTLIAYHSAPFQAAVGRWYDAVLPIVAREAEPRGPIVLVQLCNEIGMVHWLQKAADYGPGTERMYREYLRERYGGDLACLNRAHETSHASFEEIGQPTGDDRQPGRLLLDWMRFYERYYATYFAGLHARYAAHGLRLPVLANLPQFYDFDVRGRGVFAPMTAMMFRGFAEAVPGAVFGGAYQIRRLDYENFHDLAVASEVLRMIGGPEVPAMCAELQSGIMRDRPRLYPQDVELNLKTSAAHGLNALNAYMFSGGRNEPGMGAFGAYHEWQAAVAADGRRRPHFGALRDFGRQVRAFGARLADAPKHADLAIGFYAPYWSTEYLSGPTTEARDWRKQHLFYDGLARLLQLAHLNFSLLDLERTEVDELLRRPALAVFTLDTMDADTQAKLAEYLRRGGRLLLNPELPLADEGGGPCTVLADALGVRLAESRRGAQVYHVGGTEALAQGGLFTFRAPGARVLARTADGAPCALRVERHGGLALLLGMGLNHMFDYQVDLVRGFAAELGVRPAIETDPELQVCLRANGRYGFLFVANFHDAPRSGRVRMVLPGESRATVFPARGRMALPARRSFLLPLNLPLPGGGILRYATADVLETRLGRGRSEIAISGAAGAEAEIEIVTASRGAACDGHRIPARRIGKRLRLRLALSGKPQTVSLR